jgi:hypothetical protein
MAGKGKRGPNSTYRPEYKEQARKLCLLGATDEELGSFFDVDETTFKTWRKRFPDLDIAVKAGKTEADAKVAERLFQRAMGWEHPAVKIFLPTGQTTPVFAKYVERFPPDTPAASLWLRNRQPKKWRDRQEHTGADGGAITTEVVYRWASGPEDKPEEEKPTE